MAAGVLGEGGGAVDNLAASVVSKVKGEVLPKIPHLQRSPQCLVFKNDYFWICLVLWENGTSIQGKANLFKTSVSKNY